MNNLMNQKFYQETIALLREADERMALIGKIKLLIESGQLSNGREVYTYLERQIYALSEREVTDEMYHLMAIFNLIGVYADYEEEEVYFFEPLEKEISVEDMQKIVDANEKLVKELKDAKD